MKRKRALGRDNLIICKHEQFSAKIVKNVGAYGRDDGPQGHNTRADMTAVYTVGGDASPLKKWEPVGCGRRYPRFLYISAFISSISCQLPFLSLFSLPSPFLLLPTHADPCDSGIVLPLSQVIARPSVVTSTNEVMF